MPPARENLIAGRYRLVKLIGEGGMGAVWRARDELLGQNVAVKEVIFPRGLSEKQRQVRCARSVREARAAIRLSSHPCVITVYAVVEHDGRPWIAMELFPGNSLGDLICQDGPLEPQRVAEIGLCVLDALCAAHSAGIVHRDVKPANVLVNDTRIVLTDFGIAAIETDAALTATGETMGTPAYMAPESAKGMGESPASDLWSLGATLYAAVEGRPPYTGTPLAVLLALQNTDPSPSRRAGPLTPVLEGLMCREIGRRLNAGQARALLAALAPAGSAKPSTTPVADDCQETARSSSTISAAPWRVVSACRGSTTGTFQDGANASRDAGSWKPAGPAPQADQPRMLATLIAETPIFAARGRFPSLTRRRAGIVGIAACLAVIVVIISIIRISLGSSIDAGQTGSQFTGPINGSWQAATTPAAFPQIQDDQECIADHCFTTASSQNSGALLYSSGGETRWSVATVPRGVQVETPKGCYEGSCVALAESIDSLKIAHSADWGRSWRVAATVGEISSVRIDLKEYGLACSAQSCLLSASRNNGTDFFMDSTDGGVTWLTSTVPEGVDVEAPTNLSCDREECVTAVVSAGAAKDQNNALLASVDGGKSWSASLLSPSVVAASPPSCTGSKCVVGIARTSDGAGTRLSELFYSADRGKTWSASRPSENGLEHLAEPTCNASGCISAGSIEANTRDLISGWVFNRIINSKNDGESWHAARLPAAIQNVEMPACFNSTCSAPANATYSTNAQEDVATRLLYSHDGGATWHISRTPKGFLFLATPTCWTGGCVVPATYESSDTILVSNDAGTSWHLTMLPVNVTHTSDNPECAEVTCILASADQKSPNYTQIIYMRKTSDLSASH